MDEQKKDGRGGKRTAGPGKRIGPPMGNKNASKGGPGRIKASPTLAPGTKEMAMKIAKMRGYDGWGYAIDEAIELLAKQLGIE